ncbi:MAG: hypothetical protein ABIA67_07070 [Candidatus Margulisiibacteriota bacterium]
MNIMNIFAALCSVFVTGFGQVVKGDNDKGVMLLLICYFFLPAVIYLTLIINAILFPYILGFCMIFGVILWTYNIWDALVRA